MKYIFFHCRVLSLQNISKVIVALLCCSGAVLAASDNSNETQELAKQCGMCHGADGNSLMSNTPSISGMTREYFVHTLDAYKNSGRQSDMMKAMVHSLTQEQIAGLSAFYAKQTNKPRDQEFDADKARKGKQLHDKYCEKCHENAGRITENNYGFLAGQWVPYLKQAIQDYLDKKRNAPPMMIIKLNKMKKLHGEESIDLLMHYYASPDAGKL